VGVAVSQFIQPKNCNVAGDSFLNTPVDDTSLTAYRDTSDLFLPVFAFIVINHLKVAGKYI